MRKSKLTNFPACRWLSHPVKQIMSRNMNLQLLEKKTRTFQRDKSQQPIQKVSTKGYHPVCAIWMKILGQAKVSRHMWEEQAVVATLFVCFSLENIPAIDFHPCYFWWGLSYDGGTNGWSNDEIHNSQRNAWKKQGVCPLLNIHC